MRVEQCYCDRCKEETKAIVPIELTFSVGKEVLMFQLPEGIEACSECRNLIQRKLKALAKELFGKDF